MLNFCNKVVQSLLLKSHLHRNTCDFMRQFSQITSSSFPNLNIFFSDSEEALMTIAKHMTVYEDFVTENEENNIIKELEPYIKRLRYEFSHWDDAIHGYRETEKVNWNAHNQIVIQRMRDKAFSREVNQLRHVHVLDVGKDGYIKPHVDSVRFCGDTIVGLSLLSSSIMRLVCEEDKTKVVDVLLKQRSLYIMK